MADIASTIWFDRSKFCVARRRAGLSQVMVAEAAGVTSAMVSRIEGGTRQPSAPVAIRLANAVGVELADLMVAA